MYRNPKLPLKESHGILVNYGSIRYIYLIDASKTIKENPILGLISIVKEKGHNYFYVVQSSAKKGYGPALYEIAMEYAKPYYLTPSYDTNQYSGRIWTIFMKRQDIKRKPFVGNIKKEIEKYIYSTKYKIPGYNKAFKIGEKWLKENKKKFKYSNKKIFGILTKEGNKLFYQYHPKNISRKVKNETKKTKKKI